MPSCISTTKFTTHATTTTNGNSYHYTATLQPLPLFQIAFLLLANAIPTPTKTTSIITTTNTTTTITTTQQQPLLLPPSLPLPLTLPP